MPAQEWAEDDAVLFLWATSPMLENAFQVIRAWGFKYKTSFVWDKVKHNFGHYNSIRHEFLLVCTRGSCTPDAGKLFDSVQTIERSDRHSEKPEEFRKIIETLYTRGAKLELFARAYVIGEIHADFIDADEDNVSTGRNAVHWESLPGQKLEDWGQKALTFVFKQWLDLQRKEKEEKVVKTADFDRWLATRTPREQRVAKRLLGAIVDDPNIEPESAKPLLDIVKTNVEFQAFQELVDEIEESGVSVQTFLKLFEDWRLIEAREHLKLSDGRLEVMERLSECVEKGALEVKQIQPLFENNGWLANTSWGDVTGQTRYTELLRKHCTEPKSLEEKDRRIDILGYSVSGILHVVELKRPDKTLSRDDLDQVEKYVDWARANLLGTGRDSPAYASGLLIVGRLSKNAANARKMERLAGSDILVDTYDGLLDRARRVYGEVERRLKSIAPEYTREARRTRKKPAVP